MLHKYYLISSILDAKATASSTLTTVPSQQNLFRLSAQKGKMMSEEWVNECHPAVTKSEVKGLHLFSAVLEPKSLKVICFPGG